MCCIYDLGSITTKKTSMLNIKTILTPVKTVIASSDLEFVDGYDSRHLFQIPLTLNFGINSTLTGIIKTKSNSLQD